MELELLKYPVGNFKIPGAYDSILIDGWIRDIGGFPDLLSAGVIDLEDEKLNWKYRPDGWTIKQVVHHCADSHMNAFIRFKLALTEESPVKNLISKTLLRNSPMVSNVLWNGH